MPMPFAAKLHVWQHLEAAVAQPEGCGYQYHLPLQSCKRTLDEHRQDADATQSIRNPQCAIRS
jgi:hypothetical protein